MDLVSLVKVASKEISPTAMHGLTGALFLPAGVAYTLKEFVGQDVNSELLMTLFGIGALAYSTTMYQARKQVVPPKKPKEPKVEKAKPVELEVTA